MVVKFDERDAELLKARIEARLSIERITVGDYVEFQDGRVERVSYCWPDGVQTSEGGSFYLHSGGGASFSGGLNPIVPMERLQDTGERRDGRFWFFHHNLSQAFNGVDVQAPCRVFRVI